MVQPLRLTFAQIIARRLPPIIADKLYLRLYPRRVAVKQNVAFKTRAITGSTFLGNSKDYVAHRFAVLGYFDWKSIAVARGICRSGDTVVEIGANIGTETICFADIVGPTGFVKAIEPVPSNVDQLQFNVSRIGLTNVDVFPVGLGETAGIIPFRSSQPLNSGSWFVSSAEVSGEFSPSLNIPIVTLDSFTANWTNVSLVTIDTEGYEIFILRGGRQFIGQHKPSLFLEVDARHLSRYGLSLASVYTEIVALGYDVYRLRLRGIESTPKTRLFSGMWLCVHESKRACIKSVSRSYTISALSPRVFHLNPLT